MRTPTLVELREMLGRVMVHAPDDPLLHQANRLSNAVFARRAELSPPVKLGAARAMALSIDLVRLRALGPGQTTPLLSDSLDPSKVATLAGVWGQAVVGDLVDAQGRPVHVDPMLELANALDRAQEKLRSNVDQASLDVANALDKAYTAVAESTKRVAMGLAMPALVLGGAVLLFMLGMRRARGRA